MASTTNTHDLALRLAVEDDLQQIGIIEQRSNPLPWSVAQLESSLRCHQIWLVEQIESYDSNRIIAFLIAQQVLDEASLLHIAVDSKKQSQGIGRFLVTSWLGMLSTTISKVWLEVRQSNVVAQKLYLSCGFKNAGSRHDYYQHHLNNIKLTRETANIFCLNRNSN